MRLYFLVHERGFFENEVRPALTAAWRERTFIPCRPLCSSLRDIVRSMQERFRLGLDEPLLCRVIDGDVPFDRALWRHLVGEILLFGAAETPELLTAPDTLRHLLGSPIDQAHFGSRDLTFGSAIYRPGYAGLNDIADVARLSSYLATVQPELWTVNALDTLPEIDDSEEKADELEFARQCFASLRALYETLAQTGQVVVCEVM